MSSGGEPDPVNQTSGDALAQLAAVNEKTIRSAGPRYTPGVDPAAPNIEIAYLVEALDALSLVDGWKVRVEYLAKAVSESIEYRTHALARVFRRRKTTPTRLIEQAKTLVQLQDPAAIKRSAALLRRDTRYVSARLRVGIEQLWNEIGELPEETQSSERNNLQSEARGLDNVLSAVQALDGYLSGTPGAFLRGANGLLLLGSWGTGKTHLLCDIARQRVSAGAPALVVLASELPEGVGVLDSIASSTGLAMSGSELLSELNRLGASTKTRALLMVDAINEGGRDVWRRELAALARAVSQWTHVGLVVSCRRPFNDTIVTAAAERRLESVEHYGFQDQEFDAQIEYFAFYDLPAPSVPLITPEFTRPLFLKILCESIKGLGKRSQRQKLREIASGQKGMTYVLEYYTQKVGKGIEADLGLARGSCWLALKGAQVGGGIAGVMAQSGRDWLTVDNAAQSLEASLGLDAARAQDVLRRFIHDGLLIEGTHWDDGQMVSAIQFSYQRFGDHLIARHLLDAHLVTTSEDAVRRCFYRNRALGQPFLIDQWGHQFESPGIAAAIMLEFPERMKRSGLPRELLGYLPNATRRVSAVRDVFLGGLYWRPVDAFTPEAERIVGFFLTQADDWSRVETFEVLVGLATRPNHPYSASRLASYLERQTMVARDQTWSEFVRRSDEHGNVERILAWIERTTIRDDEAIANEIRLLSLLLTTTRRPLRDRATRALVLRGMARPALLFDEALESLSFNDPYVPERMLAAAYGVAMRLWADPAGSALRDAIVPFARSLVRAMFVEGAPRATKHVLSRDYALGVITLARRVNRNAIATQQVGLLREPFAQVPSPFIPAEDIAEADVADSRDAMHMDFENYTLGRLIPGRGNYQEDHPEYQQVRRQIARRMTDLGYSAEAFGQIDRSIGQMQPISRASDGGKTDRYGKKYSWIAFFEMYGVRSDLGLLDEYRANERTTDCDVDPSFPAGPQQWLPSLPDVFTNAPTDHRDWLVSGPIPDYRHLLVVPQIEGATGGPWVLLNGFIDQSGSGDREVFAFLRSLLMRQPAVEPVRQAIATMDYLGNDRVPGAGEDYYTYAGEVPWSPRYGSDYRRTNGHARRHIATMLHRFSDTLGRWIGTGRAEVPVHRWIWESYHSSLNEVSGIEFPAPALCETLGLVNRGSTVDLWDSAGRQASVYREFHVADRFGNSNLLYLRQDLLERYLSITGQVLIWVPWGERTLHYRNFNRGSLSPEIQEALQASSNNFGGLIEYSSL